MIHWVTWDCPNLFRDRPWHTMEFTTEVSSIIFEILRLRDKLANCRCHRGRLTARMTSGESWMSRCLNGIINWVLNHSRRTWILRENEVQHLNIDLRHWSVLMNIWRLRKDPSKGKVWNILFNDKTFRAIGNEMSNQNHVNLDRDFTSEWNSEWNRRSLYPKLRLFHLQNVKFEFTYLNFTEKIRWSVRELYENILDFNFNPQLRLSYRHEMNLKCHWGLTLNPDSCKLPLSLYVLMRRRSSATHCR